MNNELLINKINMPSRTFYCLMRHGIKDLNELSEYTQDDIRNIPNVGNKTFKDILNVCETYNVNLKDLDFKSILHIYECIFTIYDKNGGTLTLTQLVIAHDENEVKTTIMKSWSNTYDTMKIKRLNIYNGLIL